MTSAEQSRTIKSAFVLSIIAGCYVDVLVIVEAIFGYAFFSNPFGDELFNVLLIFGLLAGPVVMGGVALSMTKELKGLKGSQRVMFILTRIFSIISIAEGAACLIAFGFAYFVIRLLLS